MTAAPDPPETEQARLTRNLSELLQELRVAQAGVQILFAFLLSLPFTGTFASTTAFQRATYLVTFTCSGAAVVSLVAPVAYHRLLFRRMHRPELVQAAHRFALAGLALLATSITGAAVLVGDVVLGGMGSAVLGLGSAASFSVLWVVVPLRARGPLRARAGATPITGPLS